MSKKSRRRNKKILAALALAGGAAMLGKSRSTIRGQVNNMQSKGGKLIHEIIEENGKKRMYIPENIKEKMLKKSKVKVKNKKIKKKTLKITRKVRENKQNLRLSNFRKASGITSCENFSYSWPASETADSIFLKYSL